VSTIERRNVVVGALVAEGGEGKVHRVAGRPDVLYKAYRRPVPLDAVAPLLAWRDRLRQADPAMAARVAASTSWPSAAVVADGGADFRPVGSAATVSGLVIPRAPERFSLRHRDGVSHLATLSYLAADPQQRSTAYGVALPPAASVARIGLVHALARVLEAFASGATTMAHGDLSTKNVLWSLSDGPEVYLLDCDGGRLFGPDGQAIDAGHRAQVATPNWEDPAGTDLGPLSDRYSLALIFLRVVGAGHYPIQARQKRGEILEIDVEVPPWGRRSQRLSRDAEVWDLCSQGLGVKDPGARPDASAWVRVLEATLSAMGAQVVIDAVAAAQGGGARSPREPAPGDVVQSGDEAASEVAGREVAGREVAGREVAVRDVTVRAVTAEVRPSQRAPRPAPPPRREMFTAAAASSAPLVAPFGVSAGVPVSAQVTKALRITWRWWLLVHRRTARALRSSGRRWRGLRRLAFCAALDATLACVALFGVAMMVSPFLGI